MRTEKLMNNISFLFTRNKELLQQYYMLREQIYVQDFNLSDFSEHIDDYDEKEYTSILVVCDKGKVIGGVRVIFREQFSDTLLPIESEKFLLKNVLPKLALEDKSYTEINRLVLLREYRNGVVSQQILSMLVAKSKLLGANYFFAISPLVQARSYRKLYNQIGVDFKIMDEVNVPDKEYYHGKKMYLSMIELNNVIIPS
jgi:hypothetical protein